MRWFVHSVGGGGITSYHTQHHVLLVRGNIVKYTNSASSSLLSSFVCLMYVTLVTKIISLRPVTHSAAKE